jgi:hypothetical protein
VIHTPRFLRLLVPALAVALALVGPASPASAQENQDCAPGGAIGAYWSSIGGPSSFLGNCRTNELAVAGGVVQHFDGGSVYWSSATGAREVHGAIRATHNALGAASGWLRLPTTHELRTPRKPGAFNHFQGGSVYWSPSTGAHAVRGAIRDRWASMGWEDSYLGFPLRSELPTPSKPGAYSHFQGGSIYWSPSTGAQPIRGAIRDRWASIGWENSSLGFPVSGEYPIPGGMRTDFQGGAIDWDARTFTTRVIPGAVPAFSSQISTVTAAQLPSSWRSGCPVAPSSLRRVRVAHIGFDGRAYSGDLIVHADSAERMVRVFSRLYAARFPVQQIRPVDAYNGSDDASMAANNTSAFNCRRTTSGTSWSEHAYGRAVDINPVQNPYVSGSTVQPPAGREFTTRSPYRTGMILANDVVVRAFAAEGWKWGGYWNSSKDYQHFSASGR